MPRRALDLITALLATLTFGVGAWAGMLIAGPAGALVVATLALAFATYQVSTIAATDDNPSSPRGPVLDLPRDPSAAEVVRQLGGPPRPASARRKVPTHHGA